MKNKLRIIQALPLVTDDEIRSHMDFDAVVRQHRLQIEHRVNLPRGFRITLVVSILTGTAYLLWRSEDAPHALPKAEEISRVETKPADLAKPEEKTVEEKSQVAGQKGALTKQKKNKTNATSQPEVFQPEQTYLRAEPRAGYQHLYEYFSSELKYPGEAVKDSVQGTAMISFLIDERGIPTNVRVENSLGPFFDRECLRLIAQMPEWNPALLNGTPTTARISLPLTFRISIQTPTEKGPLTRDYSDHADSKPGVVQPEQTYVRAEPKAGYQYLYNYFSNELKYPKEAVKDSVQGTAVISFTIDELGRPAKVTVENSLGLFFDEECLRLIAQMPEWKPALLNGTPISARISLPLTFRITTPVPAEK